MTKQCLAFAVTRGIAGRIDEEIHPRSSVTVGSPTVTVPVIQVCTRRPPQM